MKKCLYLSIIAVLITMSLGLYAETVRINTWEVNAYTINLLESSEGNSTIEIRLNHFNRDSVNINDQDYFILSVPSSGVMLEAGKPALPIIAHSLMINAQDKMRVELLETTYIDFEGHIAPSKGNLSRTVNPADVPFTFSETYLVDAFFPETLVELGEPYIMREIRGIAFQVSPFSYNPVQGVVRAYKTMTFRVYTDGFDDVNTLHTRSSMITTDFDEIYQHHFLNYEVEQTRYTPIKEQGTLLVIAHNNFMTAIQPYVDWKRQKGIPTTLVNFSTLSGVTTAAQLKTYIANQYSANPALAFVQLVGDFGYIPSPTEYFGTDDGTCAKDPELVMIVGNDFYPDLLIGRFSAETAAQVATQVERTIHYERDLDTSATWLSKASGLASNEGGLGADNNESDIVHMNNIRTALLGYTYTQVDQFHQPSATTAQLTTAFNEGRGLINYTGHGNVTFWGNPTFSNTDINALTNSYKLPFIVSVACLVGKFNDNTCFGETWLRATHNTTGAPTGAVAGFFSTVNQPWAPPMRGQDTIINLLTTNQRRTIGGLYFNGASAMLDVYPGTETGIKTIKAWTILGDASLMVRSKTPEFMTVSADNTIAPTATQFSLNIGVGGATVAIYRPDTQTILGTTFTTTPGVATVNFNQSIETATSLILTVTAFNRKTEVRTIQVSGANGNVVFAEGFENTTSPNLPTGWTKEGGTGIAGWRTTGNGEPLENIQNNPVLAVEGTRYLTRTWAYAGTQHWVFSPGFPMIQGVSYSVRFKYGAPGYTTGGANEYDNFEVKIGTQASSNGMSSAQTLLSIVNTRIGTWTICDVSFTPSTTALHYLAFHCLTPVEEGYLVVIDDIVITQTSTPLFYPPQELTASSGDSNVTLNWTAPVTGTNGAVAGYKVYKFMPALYGFEHYQTLSAPNLTFTDTGLTNGEPYLYYVTAIYSEFGYESEPSSIVSAVPNAEEQSHFPAPRNLQGVGGKGYVYLLWDIPDLLSRALTGFVVYRDGETASNVVYTTAFYDTTVVAGMAYEYFVKAIYSTPDGESVASNSAGITVPVFAPVVGLEGFVEGNNHSPVQINLSWSEPVNDNLAFLVGYIVYRDGFIISGGDEDISATLLSETDWVDEDIANGGYYTYYIKTVYKVSSDFTPDIFEYITSDTISVSVHIVSDDDALDKVYATGLRGNYPNPFNPSTTISFTVRANNHSSVQIDIFNIKGQKVRSLVNGVYNTGEHSVVWNGTDDNGQSVGSGLYFYRMRTNDYVETKQMILMK